MAAQQVPILHRIDPPTIAELVGRGEFFWVDLALDDGASATEIARAFGLSDAAAQQVTSFAGEGSPTRKIHVESDLIVFPFWCAESPDPATPERPLKPALFRVKVLIHGYFLITVHERRIDLPELVAESGIPARSERYVVYVVLDGLTSTLLERLAALEAEIGELEELLLDAGLRPRREEDARVRSLRSDLTTLRLALGPERGMFERVSEEIEHVSGLEADPQQYFERILTQLDRATDRTDAAGEALSSALQIKLNDTSYRLTIVATIFLPLTFVTGFFGMNFGWMVANVESAADFWLLGVGSIVLLLLALVVLRWRPQAMGGRRAGSG